VYGARSCRCRPGARRTDAYPKNPPAGSRRRRNASCEARWDGGLGRLGRIRRHRDGQRPCYVSRHHRRPGAEHSSSGDCAVNRRLMRVVPAGSRTGSWPTRGSRLPCRRGWRTENLVRRHPAWGRLPAVTGHPSVRPGPGAPQAPSRPLAIRRRRRRGELCWMGASLTEKMRLAVAMPLVCRRPPDRGLRGGCRDRRRGGHRHNRHDDPARRPRAGPEQFRRAGPEGCQYGGSGERPRDGPGRCLNAGPGWSPRVHLGGHLAPRSGCGHRRRRWSSSRAVSADSRRSPPGP